MLKQKDKKNTTVLIIINSIVILVLLVSGGIFFWKSGAKKQVFDINNSPEYSHFPVKKVKLNDQLTIKLIEN